MTKSNSSSSKINTIINENKILTNPSDISNEFNDFFVNIANKLDTKLPQPIHDPLSYLQGEFPDSMEAPVASLQDFFNVVKELENKKMFIK